MIAEFITNHVFMCSILLFGVLSVFMQWLMTLSLKGYVKASANMKTTKKKVMINLKNQFETIYGMDYRVHNIAAYVDKYLLKLRFLGCSFAFWEKVPFLSVGIATLMAGGIAFYAYSAKIDSEVMIEILFSYGAVLACLFVFFHIFGIKSKKQQIQIQLVDYLENYLSNRVTRTRETSKEMKLLDENMEKVEQTLPSKDSEEDIQMLLNLVKEMDRNSLKQEISENDTDKQIAVSEEESFEENEPSEEVEQKNVDRTTERSDIELLEEFVQSFLA